MAISLAQDSTQATRAKIVCTLGPSSNTADTLRQLIEAGLNVTRHNFSHGTQDDHRRLIALVREASKATGTIVGIMADLQGPKVRVGRFKTGQTTLAPGATFVITARDIEGTDREVSTTYTNLPGDLTAGQTILLDDGLIQLRVAAIRGQDIECEVVTGGVLKNNKGINVPGAALSVAAITEKDFADAEFAVKQGVDFLAMSFVRRPEDVLRMQDFLKKLGYSVPIITKVEKPQALEVIDDIIAVSDAIMVARGDLGVEMPTEQVPAIQKELIAKCNAAGKPVITATQMLESMVNNPRPTRAEASDVANAVLDGSDAVMLSAESASGRYPVEAVATMKRIIRATEQAGARNSHVRAPAATETIPVHEGVAIAACTIAAQVDAQGIACVTLTGSMARVISKHRPARPIFALSQHDGVLRQLSMCWGVEGVRLANLDSNVDDALQSVERALVASGKLHSGDKLVLTAGLPFAARQATNMVRVDLVP
jgi:pyruvate kinase